MLGFVYLELKTANMHSQQIKSALDYLSLHDVDIKTALELVGYPPERVRDHDFTTFLRVIVGQQVSVAAANSIWTRVAALMDNSPSAEKLLAFDTDTLRSAGLSRQKASYALSLANAVASGALNLEALYHMDDNAVVQAITQVKGFGRWSAHMIMISSLARPDVWPIDDIAVQEGIRRILKLDDRPKPKELERIGERWQPQRSAVALLAWHYYGIVALPS